MTDALLAVVKLQWRLRGERTEEQMTLPRGSDSPSIYLSPPQLLWAVWHFKLSCRCPAFSSIWTILRLKPQSSAKVKESCSEYEAPAPSLHLCVIPTSKMVCCSVSVWSFRLMCCACSPAGIDSPEDVCILYSNRAACYLKDGNSSDCIQDCTKYVANFSPVHVCPFQCSFSQI